MAVENDEIGEKSYKTKTI